MILKNHYSIRLFCFLVLAFMFCSFMFLISYTYSPHKQIVFNSLDGKYVTYVSENDLSEIENLDFIVNDEKIAVDVLSVSNSNYYFSGKSFKQVFLKFKNSVNILDDVIIGEIHYPKINLYNKIIIDLKKEILYDDIK